MSPPRYGQNNGSQPTGEVQVVIQAESDDNQTFDWHTLLRIHEPVGKVARAWATAYGVPPNSVGLDDQSGRELALDSSPAEYGWVPGTLVSLKAYPTEENLMANEEAAPPASAIVPMPAAPKSAPMKRPASAIVPTPAAPKSPPTAANERRHTLRRRKGSLSRGSASAEANGPRSAKPKQQPQQQMQKVYARPAGRGGGAPKAAAPGKAAAVIWDQTNPKRPGSNAFDRYERYKRAKSMDEALSMGAITGDIRFDLTRGFLKHR